MAVMTWELQRLYLAYFGRPVDVAGAAFYTSNPGFTMQMVAAAFSASPESQTLYGATFNSSVINNIYLNLFNREAEADGLNYWTGEVTAGRITPAGAALAILQGAQNEDMVAVDNKLFLSALFGFRLDTDFEAAGYGGTVAAQVARDFLYQVDGTSSSVELAQRSLDAAVAATTAAGSITNLNTLRVASAMANGSTIDLAAFPGKMNLVAAASLVADGTATLSGLVSAATVELAGNLAGGMLKAIMKVDSGDDAINLKLNPSFADDNDAKSEVKGQFRIGLDVSGIDHLSVVSTATQTANFTPVFGYEADATSTTLELTDPELRSVYITGDQALTVQWNSSDPGGSPLVGLDTVDATRLTALETITTAYSDGAVAFVFYAPNSSAYAIAGSDTSRNELWGNQGNNEIIGGSSADLLAGGGANDIMTGGAGHDLFFYGSMFDSNVLYGNVPDTITDFSANTVGQGSAGKADSRGATTDPTKRTGDVIDLRHFVFHWDTPDYTAISVAVRTNEADANLFLMSVFSGGGAGFAAVLDSTTNVLYMDTTFDGMADMVIVLTGVTSLTEAAFLI